MVLADLRREFEIGAQECGPQLGHQFLVGIALVAPALAAEVAIEARRMFRGVNTLMRESPVKAFGITEALDRRQLDVVGFLRVVGPAAPVADVEARCGEESTSGHCWGSRDSASWPRV